MAATTMDSYTVRFRYAQSALFAKEKTPLRRVFPSALSIHPCCCLAKANQKEKIKTLRSLRSLATLHSRPLGSGHLTGIMRFARCTSLTQIAEFEPCRLSFRQLRIIPMLYKIFPLLKGHFAFKSGLKPELRAFSLPPCP